MKEYIKEQVINEVINILKYHNDDKVCLLFANLLLTKINNNEKITLTKEEITNALFMKDSNKINDTIFNFLSQINADLSGINFDGKIIQGLNFSRLDGVVIDLDLIPDKNISKTTFKGVALKGTLDNAIIECTDFTGYIGDIHMDPQKVKNKSIKGAILSGLTINGSFDNVVIDSADFSDTKGNIIINPQKVPNKELIGINFSNVLLCDNTGKIPTEASFDGCKIYQCKFNNAKGKLIIDLNSLDSTTYPKLSMCDLTGVLIKGNAKSNYEPKNCIKEAGTVIFRNINDDLFGSYYYDSEGNYIHIYLYKSMMWDDILKCWKEIPRENEQNLKINVTFKELYKNEERNKKLMLHLKKHTKRQKSQNKIISSFRKIRIINIDSSIFYKLRND